MSCPRSIGHLTDRDAWHGRCSSPPRRFREAQMLIKVREWCFLTGLATLWVFAVGYTLYAAAGLNASTAPASYTPPVSISQPLHNGPHPSVPLPRASLAPPPPPALPASSAS